MILLLRKGRLEESEFQAKEFGKDLKTSSCDDAAVHLNGMNEDVLINWGTNIPTDSLNGFSSKEISFKWEPEESKPIETRVFEVFTGSNMYFKNIT